MDTIKATLYQQNTHLNKRIFTQIINVKSIFFVIILVLSFISLSYVL